MNQPSLAPTGFLSRPVDSSLAEMEKSGIEPSFAHVLETLWQHRPIIWASSNTSPKDLKEIGEKWFELNLVTEEEDMFAWTKQMRRLLWGTGSSWPIFQESGTVKDYRLGLARLLFFVGGPTAQWVGDDKWYEEAREAKRLGLSYEDIANRTRATARARYGVLPVYPEGDADASVVALKKKASELINRFGFRYFASSAGTPFDDVASSITGANQSLSAMAFSLGWHDREIGASHLGLTAGLSKSGQHRSAFSHLTGAVHLGYTDCWGSFAHEWGHALDHAVGQMWRPGSYGDKSYASYLSDRGFSIIDRERWGDMYDAWRGFTSSNHSPESKIDTRASVIKQLPLLLADLAEMVPHHSWEPVMVDITQKMKEWGHPILLGEGDPLRWHNEWDEWRAHSVEQLRSCKSGEPWKDKAFIASWEQAVSTVGHLLWSEELVHPVWVSASLVRDVKSAIATGDEQAYWSTPEELFARLVDTVVRTKMGNESWVSRKGAAPEVAPQGKDVRKVCRWWDNQNEAVRGAWGLSQTEHRARWHDMCTLACGTKLMTA